MLYSAHHFSSANLNELLDALFQVACAEHSHVPNNDSPLQMQFGSDASTPEEATQRAEQLRAEINRANRLYYIENAPELDDAVCAPEPHAIARCVHRRKDSPALRPYRARAPSRAMRPFATPRPRDLNLSLRSVDPRKCPSHQRNPAPERTGGPLERQRRQAPAAHRFTPYESPSGRPGARSLLNNSRWP